MLPYKTDFVIKCVCVFLFGLFNHYVVFFAQANGAYMMSCTSLTSVFFVYSAFCLLFTSIVSLFSSFSWKLLLPTFPWKLSNTSPSLRTHILPLKRLHICVSESTCQFLVFLWMHRAIPQNWGQLKQWRKEGRKETFKSKQRNVPLKIFRSVWA